MTTTEETNNELELEDIVEAPSAPQTIQQFFESLPVYTFVHGPGSRHGTEYVFTGFEDNGEGMVLPTIWHTHYMTKSHIDPDYLASVNTWETSKLEEGETPKVADRELRMALRVLGGNRNELNESQQRVSELEGELSQALSDYMRVNTFMNDYAQEVNFCSDYERRIFGWNETLHNKLIGRTRSYQVPVRIPAISEHPVNVYPVEARSPEEARSRVENMSNLDIMRHFVNGEFPFRGLEVFQEGTPIS
jgi:hypothetical protein